MLGRPALSPFLSPGVNPPSIHLTPAPYSLPPAPPIDGTSKMHTKRGPLKKSDKPRDRCGAPPGLPFPTEGGDGCTRDETRFRAHRTHFVFKT